MQSTAMRSMVIAIRVLLVAMLASVAAFCVFGFLATFEPLPWATQWAWRAVYSVVGLLSVTAAVWVLRPRRHRRAGRRHPFNTDE